jgi:GNAT superfamily N-acetyltransferase
MGSNHKIVLQRTDSNNPDFKALAALMDEDLRQRYGPAQSVYEGYNDVGDITTIIIAYIGPDAVGCGCFRKFNDNTVEIKRMFVKPAYRGQGVAARILADLEAWAEERGYSHSILETGKKQPEAIHLYEKSGYAITINYGPYTGLDNSVCMRKKLS